MAGRGVHRGVHSSLLDDPDFQRLSSDARLALYTVRLCKQAGPAVIFRYYPALLMAQSGLPARRLESGLVELEGARWIAREGVVLWVRNGLRHDPTMRLANRKHRAAVERAVAELPKCQLVLTFCDYYGIAKPFDSLSRFGPPNTEEDRGTTRDTTRKPINTSPRAEEAAWPSPELLVQLYNQAAPDECPEVTELSPGRRKKARDYLAMFPTRAFWEETCGQIHASRFLRGLRPGPGHEKFVADFDWLLTKGKDGTENCVKTYEGKYHD